MGPRPLTFSNNFNNQMKLHPEVEAKAEVEKKQQNHHLVSRLDCSPVAMQSACDQALNQETL